MTKEQNMAKDLAKLSDDQEAWNWYLRQWTIKYSYESARKLEQLAVEYCEGK